MQIKFPKEPKNYLGLALVAGIFLLGVGGLIAAFQGNGPSDAMVTAITSLLSAMVGGLIGHSIPQDKDKNTE